MICPYCQAENKVSRVYPNDTGRMTCLGHMPYYDEKGNFHDHNPNCSTYEVSCSEGHRYSVLREKSCPFCDWKGKTFCEICHAGTLAWHQQKAATPPEKESQG